MARRMRIVERRAVPIDQQVGLRIGRLRLADCRRRLDLESLIMAGVTTVVKVMSSLPATKVSSEVARLGMIEYSIASR